MAWVGAVADWATLIAAAIAILGFASLVLSRPRVSIEPGPVAPNSGAVVVSHTKGTASARGLQYAVSGHSATGVSLFADGLMPWLPELTEGARATLWLSLQSDTSVPALGPLDLDGRFHDKADVLYVAISWRGTLLPWRRAYAVVRWNTPERESGGNMTVARGARPYKAWRRSLSTGSERS